MNQNGPSNRRTRQGRYNWPKITICILLFLTIFVVVLSVMIRFVILAPCNSPTTPITTTTITTTPTTTITTTLTTTTRTTTTPCQCDCKKCFSKNTNITMSDGSSRAISRVRVGDRVLVFGRSGITSSPILAMLTHFQAPKIDFIDVYTSNTTLRLTPSHFLLISKHKQGKTAYMKAHEVSVGDFVFSSSLRSNITPVPIIRIEKRTLENEDAYTPLTLEGTIIVNDLVASCYSTYNPSIIHVITKPLQWWFWFLVENDYYHIAEWTSRLAVCFLDFYNGTLDLWYKVMFILFTQVNEECFELHVFH